MIIRNKFNGYAGDGRRLYPGGGGGPTQSTSYQTNIPEYAEPYVQTMLGATEKQVYTKDASGNVTGFRPFQSYSQYDTARGGTGETVAGFTPMQVGAMRGVQNYQLPGQTGAASQLAGMAGMGSMGAGQNYMSMATNPYATQAFMSPYIQGALAPQLEEARRQSDISGQQQAAQAVQQGAFGGARHGIVEAERQRNLAKQQEAIYGQGMQNAFQSAQQAQQFGANLGLQGYGQGLQAAGQLGQLGQQQYGQELGLMGKQMEVGTQQQQYEQARLNQIIQDYATSQQYPMMQLGVLSNMLRGLPMQASTTQMYQAQPSAFSQGMGAMGTGMSIYNQGKQAGMFKGGGIVGMAEGGVTSDYAVADIVAKLSDKQLQDQLRNPKADPAVKEAAGEELQRRAQIRGGMAGGGIVAFAEGDKVEEDPDAPVPKPKVKEIAPGADAGILQGIAAAEAPDEKTAAVPTPDIQEAPAAAGIAQAEPAAPAPAFQQDNGLSVQPRGVATGLPNAAPAPVRAKAAPVVEPEEQELADYAARQKGIMGRTPAQQAEINAAERAKLGIVSPYEAERAKLEERRKKAEGNAKEEYMDRLSEFLMTWGSLPGPTLVAANNAGRMFIANSIADKKERKRLLDSIDDSVSALNKAQYLEKVGDHKEAQAQIENAGKIFFDVNEKLLQGKQKKAEIQSAMDRTLATLASEEARAAAKNELEERLKTMEVNKRTDFMNQVEMRTKALVAKGAPNNERTVNEAMTQIIEETKGLDAKMLAAMAAQTSAGANVTRAETGRDEATTKQRKAFRSDLLTTEMKPENEKAISKARKADKAAGIDITSPNSQERAVRQDIESKLLSNPAYNLLSRDDVTSLPAAKEKPKAEAPKAEAPKAEPKKAEPKKEAPAKPDIKAVEGAPAGSSVGSYVASKGWEVKNKDGKLIGYVKQ